MKTKLPVLWATILIVYLFTLSGFPEETFGKNKAGNQAETSKIPSVTKERMKIKRYQHDPLALRALHPTFDEFPDSSLIDFSYLLDPPAGKHGFVIAGNDGHFHFEKTGERIRFWGVTVASSHIDIPKERIRQAVDVIARAGCNVLRLHEIDNRGGEKYNLVRRNIIDEAYPHNNDSQHFDKEYRDRVDYWIYCAKQKGIYIYLVIRGYRTFRKGDGVASADQLDRKAAPYGFFDQRLLELQDQYIEDWLFNHTNPYTELPNGLDPAVCMLEVENEDSLLFNPTSWTRFIEPYKSQFQKLWNKWLKDKYGNTEALHEAWAIPDGSWSALMPDENLSQDSVLIPDMKMRSISEIDLAQDGNPLSHPLRQNDGARFAADIQRTFFRRQRDLIRSSGSPIPLTAVVNSQNILDTWSVARELDFTGENAYQDHPAFKSGEAWVGKSFFRNVNYLKESGPWSPAAFMARYKWAGKPLVCREWANCWPNKYRGSANLFMASQALRQDYDGMIYFSYYTWGNQNICSPFGIQADPAQWGTFGYAAHLFLGKCLAPAENVIDIAFTDHDLFCWGNYVDHLHTLARDFRVQNHYFPGAVQSEAALRISSGRSGRGVFTGINNILWDADFSRWDKLPLSQRKQSIFQASGFQEEFIFKKEDFPTSTVIRANYKPLWEKNGYCNAFLEPGQNNIILKDAESTKVVEAARLVLSGLPQKDSSSNPEEKKIPPPSHPMGIIKDEEKGRMIINTPGFMAIQGEFNPGKKVTAGILSVISKSPVACIAVISLDKKSVEQSTRIGLKMTTVAQNRGQLLRPAKGDNLPAPYILEYPGGSPVQTMGEPSDAPTTIYLGDRMLLRAYLINGTWEAILDRSKNEVLLSCDTPNIRFELGPAAFGSPLPRLLAMQKYYYEFPTHTPVNTPANFIYPGFAKYIRIFKN